MGAQGVGALLVLAARQTSKALRMQNLPDGGDTEGSAVVFQGSLDVIDGKILLAQGEDELADGVFLGLGAGTGFEVAEEIGWGAAEVVAEHAKGTVGIAESFRGQLGRDTLDEKGAERLVLAVGRGGGLEEEAGLFC